jgi:hypothetical protein
MLCIFAGGGEGSYKIDILIVYLRKVFKFHELFIYSLLTVNPCCMIKKRIYGIIVNVRNTVTMNYTMRNLKMIIFLNIQQRIQRVSVRHIK